jgi:hypothetical protein
LLSHSPINAAVGRVTEQTGPMEIVRAKKSVSSAVNTAVEMNDTVVTARSRAQLTFEDNTTVKISEQSKLLIDDFVYDANRGTGRLALKVALGTAKYASGQIAKSNPQQVAVKTPTATIAVRGTDFSMTVDELGRSIVMLLPSCDAAACVTGVIEVFNNAGSVTMDTAYQATFVSSVDVAPQAPVVLNIDPANISNLMIVSFPTELKTQEVATQSQTSLDVDFLNQRFLEFDELNKNLLSTYKRLDKDFLDSDFLFNALDAGTAAMIADADSILSTNQMLPGYQASSLLKWNLDDENRLILRRDLGNAFEIWMPSEQDAILQANQAGVPLYQQINNGGTTRINITQR